MDKLALTGFILIFSGILFVIISGILNNLKGNGNLKVAFGGFIGPIPFGFFTNPEMFWVWVIVVIAGIILWIISRRIL